MTTNKFVNKNTKLYYSVIYSYMSAQAQSNRGIKRILGGVLIPSSKSQMHLGCTTQKVSALNHHFLVKVCSNII